MLIQVITGHETFSGSVNSTIRVLAFYRAPGSDKEMPINEALGDGHSGVTLVGRPEYISASTRNTNNGSWWLSRYTMPEGAFLKFSISRKLRGAFIQQTKQFYLLLREQAASRRLRIPFTGSPDASLSCGYIEGRFDVLDLEGATAFGIDIPDRFAAQFDFEDDYERDTWFENVVVEPEFRPLAVPTVSTVQTSSGRSVRVAKSHTPRLIKIRNRKEQ